MGKIVKFGLEVLPKELSKKEVHESLAEVANYFESNEVNGKLHDFVQIIILPYRVAILAESGIIFLLRERD